jgi:hypothetical protein
MIKPSFSFLELHMPIMHAGSYQEDKSGKEQNKVEFSAPRPAIRSEKDDDRNGA